MREDLEKAKAIIDEAIRIAGTGEVLPDNDIQDFYNKGNANFIKGFSKWMDQNRKERNRREEED